MTPDNHLLTCDDAVPLATNIEVKARLSPEQHDAIPSRLGEMDVQMVETIDQDDHYFACKAGRLKLRRFSSGAGQLIFYRREVTAAPKTSRYLIAEVGAPEALDALLTAALGCAGRISKQRRLFLIDRTRIHLDAVRQLGFFVELEVVMQPGEPAQSGEATAAGLILVLGIPAHDLVPNSYIDLLAEDMRHLTP